jgi:hypothetical protein
MGAYSGQLVKRFSLPLLVLGIVSVVVAACGRTNEASPAATSGTSPPPTSGTSATPTSDTLSRCKVARLFHYDRLRPLAIARFGSPPGAAGPGARWPVSCV